MKQTDHGIAGLLSSNRIDVTRSALICDQVGLSYTQLDQWVGGLCATLSAQGARAGMTVGSVSHDPLLNLLLMHALPRLGCVFLPLDPSLPAGNLRRFLEQSEMDLLITGGNVVRGAALLDAEWITDRHIRVGSRPELHRDIESERSCLDAHLSVDQPHWLIASSGSEGEGRLVVLTGGQLMSSVRASRERLEFSETGSWLMCLPVFHVGGLMIPLRCAEAGAMLVLHETYDSVRLWQDLNKYEITHVSLVPTMLAHLLTLYRGESVPSALRVMLVGGGALATSMAQVALDAGWPVCPSYGMTEVASQAATVYPPPSHYIDGMVGKPLSHLQVKIEAASGRIMIKGESVMQGYAGQQKYLDDWFVTSDRGQLDNQGNLILLGRTDDRLISGGENLYPQQVEQILVGYPGILDVAVTGVSDLVWGDRLVALYVGDLSGEALNAWSRAQLPGFMRPKEFLRVDSLPRTALGKLRRRALPELYDRAQRSEY